ncbi:SMI1/KNR4 family protein [Martelella soudanensis]|uniref:SMI1/KNR4 family protein n=1 Tax=unclassified Martelella TaxID=2629616 RepID=UPI0015DFDBAD|nr:MULTISPECIES: SMI1/KNR4 family protein [unclassified Martelella]
MKTVQDIAGQLAFSDDASIEPYAPECIAELEDMMAASFPDDLRWYFEHFGARKLCEGQRSLPLCLDGYHYVADFEGLPGIAETERRYRRLCGYVMTETLPYDRRRYFPIGQVSTATMSLCLSLLVSLHPLNFGTVWGVSALAGHHPLEPVLLAKDFTALLEMIEPKGRLPEQAKQLNDALLDKIIRDHGPRIKPQPTRAASAKALVAFYLDHPDETVFDGLHNLEVAYYIGGQNFHGAAAAMAQAQKSSTDLSDRVVRPGPVRRRQVRISQPQRFVGTFRIFPAQDSYSIVTIESVVGIDQVLEETFVLHHSDAGWALVARQTSNVDPVEVDGFGTLAFDVFSGWRFLTPVTPRWSRLPVGFRAVGEEDALTLRRLAFVRDILKRSDLRPALEKRLFDLYLPSVMPLHTAFVKDGKYHERLQTRTGGMPVINSATEI